MPLEFINSWRLSAHASCCLTVETCDIFFEVLIRHQYHPCRHILYTPYISGQQFSELKTINRVLTCGLFCEC